MDESDKCEPWDHQSERVGCQTCRFSTSWQVVGVRRTIATWPDGNRAMTYQVKDDDQHQGTSMEKLSRSGVRPPPDWACFWRVLYPWTIPVQWLAYFPVAAPAVCLAGVGFARLPQAGLPSRAGVTWSQGRDDGDRSSPVPGPDGLCSLRIRHLPLRRTHTRGSLALVEWSRGEPQYSLSANRPGKTGAASSRGDRLLWDPELDG